MYLSTHNRVVLRGLLAGAMVITGASACSRSDRADRGRDTTPASETGAAVQPDTQPTATAQPSTPDHTAEKKQPTSTASKRPTSRPTSEPSVPSVEDSTGETSDYGVSGYRAMGHDSSSVAIDSAADPSVAVTTDTATGMPGDTSNAVAVDSSSAPADSSVAVAVDTSMAADTAAAAAGDSAVAGYAQVTNDTSASTQVIDSSASTEAVAVQPAADTAVVAGDSAETGKTGERIDPSVADRISSSEDSTETPNTNAETPEVASSAEPDTQATGAARTSEMATGADAVALMSRQGLQCIVAEADSNGRQWDMASTPATLNPCGLGTMQLSRIWTGEK